jgi:glycosyltransferase involved in cell wall biosynthesis
MQSEITALVITFNEAANIARCLDRLRWVGRVLVIDSFSRDATLEIAQSFPNVTIVQRAFDTFAQQCNFGLSQVTSKWVLSLDCDYILGAGFEEEIAALPEDESICGYSAGFRFCIHGRPLSATLYPARCVLYRKDAARYDDEGHGHRVRVSGKLGALRTKIDHDDRKPLARWLDAQLGYAPKEAEHLLTAPLSELSRVDRLRKTGCLLPWLAPVYCLVFKGLWRDGVSGWHYTLQRWLAECIIALAIAERRCASRQRGTEEAIANSLESAR